MTEASTGLRKALARKAGVSQLSTEELIAQMTDEQKIALAAALPTASAADPAKKCSDDEDEDDMEDNGDGEKKPDAKKKDNKMKDKETAASADAGTQRALAVMSSEHFAGHEAQAKTLLANDKLSADEIITILADLKPAAPADLEADARADMQAALKENAPSGVEANSSGLPAQVAGNIWENSYAKLGLIKPAA